MSFTSCNTDGDSGMNILTLEQQKSFQYAMATGSYNNMTILYEKKNDANVKNQVDSVASACSISMYGDSTMTMTNFPVAALAEHINNKDLAAAIAKVTPRNIKCKYNVMPNSTSEVAYFIACPNAVDTLCNGSSAIWKGMFILSVRRLSSPRNSAPPPAR